MDIDMIKELIRVMGGTNLESIEIESEGFSIKLRNRMSTVAASPRPTVTAEGMNDVFSEMAEGAQEDGFDMIKSPMVGIFNLLDGVEFAQGEEIAAGTIVASVEAMKMVNEVEAPFKCVFESYCVNPGQTVEFNQPLLKVKRL